MKTLYHCDGLSVIDQDDCRYLLRDGVCQSGVNLKTGKSTAQYTDYFHLGVNDSTRHVLFIGGGGCVAPQQFLDCYPNIDVDVVEIDMTTADLAEQYFGYNGPIHVMGGDEWLSRCKDLSYDLVVVDAYAGGTIAPLDISEIRRVGKSFAINYFDTQPDWVGPSTVYHIPNSSNKVLISPPKAVSEALKSKGYKKFYQLFAWDNENA